MRMDRLMLLAGRISGIVGLVLCAFSGMLRLAGHYVLGGYQLTTLMQAGIAGLAAGCFLLLWARDQRAGMDR